MEQKIAKLQKLIDAASRIVFLGGAGVSTESGIPDFRSPDGLYSQTYKYPPEVMLSHSFFVSHTAEFYEFYRAKMLLPPHIKPNAAHIFLARLEKAGKLTAVITQNIDGLHQAAGSDTLLELHGSVWRNHCTRCDKFFSVDAISVKVRSPEAGQDGGVPRCACGGIIKPDVVLYEEGLNYQTLNEAAQHISRADLMIIGGTSLNVYPAAGLIRFFKGNALVIINKSATQYDQNADLLISSGIAKVFSALNINE